MLFLEDGSWWRGAAARRGRAARRAPAGRERAAAALANPNAGEVIVSAAPGAEFADLGGRHHAGGGSHGSLEAGDSLVPMLTVGIGPPPDSITGIAPLLCTHFGVEPPPYARRLADVA